MPISVLSGQSWASGQLGTTGEGRLSGEKSQHLSLRRFSLHLLGSRRPQQALPCSCRPSLRSGLREKRPSAERGTKPDSSLGWGHLAPQSSLRPRGCGCGWDLLCRHHPPWPVGGRWGVGGGGAEHREVTSGSEFHVPETASPLEGRARRTY